MDLNLEIEKLQRGQEQILDLLKQNVDKRKDFKIYSFNDLVKLFGVTKRTIYNWKEEGRLSLTIIGSKTFMTEAQLQEFLEKNEVKSLKSRRKQPC